MIRIDFEEPDTPEWQEWREKCDEEQARYTKAIESGNPSPIRDTLYKGQKNEVYFSLEGPFRGKCAYCETKTVGDQYGDVEHYRPKSRVTDEFGSPVTTQIEGETVELPGYYWLVYSWKNLLPSCVLCNRPSTQNSRGRLIGKRDQFPVRGFRATRPTEEEYEEPLLIHPAWDDPDSHLGIEKIGILCSKTDVGDMSIGILGLNDRDLPHDRGRKYKDVALKMSVLAEFLSLYPNSQETKELLNDLLEIQQGRDEFTLAARRAIDDCKDNLMPILDLF